MKFLTWFRGKRLLESHILIFGKGIWITLLADYAGCLYVFSFTLTKLFHCRLMHNLPRRYSNPPKWEFNLSVFGKEIVNTAKEYHAGIRAWCEKDKQERKEEAQTAKDCLESADLLEKAEHYKSGYYLLDEK